MTDTRFSDYFITTLQDDLVAYWRCDEVAGSTLADTSPNSHDLTITGTPTFAETGLLDNEINDSIKFPSSSVYAAGIDDSDFYLNQFTIIMLVNGDPTAISNTYIDLFQVDANTYNSWELYLLTNGKASLVITDIGLTTHQVDSASAIPTNKNTFLCATFNAGALNSDVGIWVNGERTSSTLTGVTSIGYADARDLRIGNRTAENWPGGIDEVIFLNRALTNAEIGNAYEYFSNGFPTATISIEPQPPKDGNPIVILQLLPSEFEAKETVAIPSASLRIHPVFDTPEIQAILTTHPFATLQRNFRFPDFPRIGRAFVGADGYSTIEVPMSQWQCRHSYRYKSSINVTVPDDELITQIEDRKDGFLTIKFGYLDTNTKEETLEEILTADIVSISKTRTFQTFTAVIEAERLTQNDAPKEYELTAPALIQSKDEFVTYTMPIEVFVKPADLVTLYDQSVLAVGEITYQGTPSEATMTLVAADDIQLFQDPEPDKYEPTKIVTYGVVNTVSYRILRAFPWSSASSS